MGRVRYTLKIEGMDKAFGKLKKIDKKLINDVDDILQAAAFDTNDDAISNIQREGAIDLGAGGGLISHQQVRAIGKNKYEVLNSSKYAPFIEWGTGRQVSVPAEWAQYAMKYKGPYPGTWDEFEENIRAWMKRHGIPDRQIYTASDGTESYIDVTYSIMIKILERGLPARPFLYPAYVKNKAEVVKRLKELFK